MTAAIRARGLRRQFGAVTAVDGVDLDVERGAALALVGTPGSGRTTLLMLLAGLLQPSGGELIVGGVDAVMDPRAARLHVAYAGSRPIGSAGLTVAEYLQFVSRGPRAPRGLERDAVALGISRLGVAAGADIDRLPPAQRRLVAVAAALILRPAVVLLDEPFAGSDHPAGVLDWIAELRRDGTTFVTAVADIADAERLADDALRMEAGRIISTAPLASPSRVAVAAFAGVV